MSYNLSGMNFNNAQSKSKLPITLSNQITKNDARSSSAYNQHFQSSDKRKIIDDHVNKIYNLMPKHIKNKDKLRDELIKLKVEYNAKVKDYNTLKVDYSRLEDDNNKNNKIIEEFINEASKYSPKINNLIRQNEDNEIEPEKDITNQVLSENFIDNYNKNNPNKLTFSHINPGNIIKLREVFIINNLKKQVLNFKNILKLKEEEINNLKTNSKVAKLQLLEIEYRMKNDENYALKEKLEILKEAFDENEFKLNKINSEKEYYKKLSTKINNQLEDHKEKLKHYQQENLKIIEQKKSLEDKNHSSKLAANSIKTAIKEKENELNNLKEEIKNVEIFSVEKPKLEKKIQDLQKHVVNLKEDQERKAHRIKDLEKLIVNNKTKFDEDLDCKTATLNKKIKALEQELINIKKENSSPQSSAFLTQNASAEQTKKIEDLEKKILIYNDQIDNEVLKCTELELRLEEFEKLKKMLMSTNSQLVEENNQLNERIKEIEKKLIEIEIDKTNFNSEKIKFEEENVRMKDENTKFNIIISELNQNLMKYKNLDKNLTEASTQKDVSNKDIKIMKLISETEENPYKKKKKNQKIESIKTNTKVLIDDDMVNGTNNLDTKEIGSFNEYNSKFNKNFSKTESLKEDIRNNPQMNNNLISEDNLIKKDSTTILKSKINHQNTESEKNINFKFDESSIKKNENLKINNDKNNELIGYIKRESIKKVVIIQESTITKDLNTKNDEKIEINNKKIDGKLGNIENSVMSEENEKYKNTGIEIIEKKSSSLRNDFSSHDNKSQVLIKPDIIKGDLSKNDHPNILVAQDKEINKIDHQTEKHANDSNNKTNEFINLKPLDFQNIKNDALLNTTNRINYDEKDYFSEIDDNFKKISIGDNTNYENNSPDINENFLNINNDSKKIDEKLDLNMEFVHNKEKQEKKIVKNKDNLESDKKNKDEYNFDDSYNCEIGENFNNFDLKKFDNEFEKKVNNDIEDNYEDLIGDSKEN